MAVWPDSGPGKGSLQPRRGPIRLAVANPFCPLLLIAALACGGVDAQTPQRFRDALDTSSDWDIAVPTLQSPSGMDAAIQSGTALDSAAYLAIDRELRGVMRRLERDPSDPETLGQLETLRERLRQRVAINLEAGFPYAAGVYIELLRIAGASPSEIRRLTAMLRERRD